MSFSPSFITNLQATIDLLAKKREETGHRRPDDFSHSYSSHHSNELHERVGNIERSIIHILTRLDRIEDSVKRSEKPSSIDDVLSSTEKMLREIMVELLKQQNLIEKYRQENESLREKTSTSRKPPATSNPTPTSASTSAAATPAHPPVQKPSTTIAPIPLFKPNPTVQAAPKAAASANKPPAKPTTPRRDGEAEADTEHARVALPVDYPAGYNPKRGRRFSVAGESYNPNTDFRTAPRNIIPKSQEARNRIRTVIVNNILFKSLEEDQLDDLIDEMFEVKLKPDDVIIRQGDDGDNFYVVDSGELYVLYKDVVVATIGVGKGFGEIALMYMCPRTATIKAKTDVITWGMSRATFRRSLMIHAIRKRELYESFLARVPLLQSLLPYERSIIADALESRVYKDGDHVITEGEKGDAFYIIEKGKAVATKGNPPVEVKSYAEADYFGELALLTDQPRAANVRALGEKGGVIRVLFLRREDFSALMGPCEEILKRNTQTYNQINTSLKVEVTPPMELMSPKLAKAQTVAEIAHQLIKDEDSYFQGLAFVVEEYLKPMRLATRDKSLPIDDEDLAQLFSHTEMLLSMHTLLATQALPPIAQNPSLIGITLLKAAPGLKFHGEFRTEWPAITKVLDKYKSDSAVQAFFKSGTRANADLRELLKATYDRISVLLGFLKAYRALAPQDKNADSAIEALGKFQV